MFLHDCFIFSVSPTYPTQREFLEIASVTPRTLAARIFIDIYNELFANSFLLNEEYERWHSCEYESLSSFVDSKYNLKLPMHNDGDLFFLVDAGVVFLQKIYEGNLIDECLKMVGATREVS